MTVKLIMSPRNRAAELSLDSIGEHFEKGIRAGFFAVGSQLRHTARLQMLEKKKGIKHANLRVRSSAVGETPASQTGKLRRSIGYQVSGDSMEFGAGGRGSGVNYALILEEDLARPLLVNSVKKNEAKIETLFNDAINKALESVS